MRVLNTAQMREADRRTIETAGVPAAVLMESAGRQVVEAIQVAFADRLDGTVAVLCGRGNNGGDGFVAARALHERGTRVHVALAGRHEDVRGDAAAMLRSLQALGVEVAPLGDEAAWAAFAPAVASCALVVDALVGTGLTRSLDGLAAAIVADVNAMGLPIVAVDLPSGLSADTPALIGPAIEAAMTVAFAAPKLSLVLPPADGYAGSVVVADIGIPEDVIDALDGPRVELLTPEILRVHVGPRPSATHKGDAGRVTIVAGSRGKTGAAVLAGRGALRSGAGLVTIATPASCLPLVASGAPEYMTLALPETGAGEVGPGAADIVLTQQADVIVCGPGLGRGPDAADLVRALLARATVPLVLDADAVTVLSDTPEVLLGSPDRPVTITPHPGEMARLLGRTIDDVQADRLETARGAAAAHGVHVVLKGHRTVVATPDGTVYINPTGNPGMATGGTGDVLSGVLGAWLAQLGDAEDACALAVFAHGLAGDVAAERHGQIAMTAGDVVESLGAAYRRLAGEADEADDAATEQNAAPGTTGGA